MILQANTFNKVEERIKLHYKAKFLIFSFFIIHSIFFDFFAYYYLIQLHKIKKLKSHI